MKHKQNWIIAIVLSVTAGAVAWQSGIAPSSDEATHTSTITPTVEIVEIPNHGNCAYTWAYHDAPALTEKINTAVRNIDSNASARAELFGEDCVYADGSSTFGAVETDFYIHLAVDNLADEEAFGNWMAQALSEITQIPEEEIQGNPGFVEFWFEKTETEHVIVRVPIQQYKDLGQGKTGGELFRVFYNSP